MKKVWVISEDDFKEELFRKAEVILCKEMSESWMNSDFIRTDEDTPLILEKGESVAVLLTFEGSSKIYSVYTIGE
ncbi:MAG: hypothetical protein NTY33_00080 [Candidatus Moranbacteria bacterium]|nr:hypothetical protein [Candidatus Moranbacteria bacterium]